MNNEQLYNSDIKVSIICLAYNHERYIKKTLDGFVMQKTNFKFEILIHDDASTDSTASIIREYEKKYPDIIKPIYQTENQYSKKVRISATYLYPRAKGKYIALCEGDDFWIDENKLQIQFDYMESHPECSICTHASFVVDETGTKLLFETKAKSKIIAFEDILFGNTGVHTASYFFINDIFPTPKFRLVCKVGDHSLLIFLALKGEVHYIDRFMAIYRHNSVSSIQKVFADSGINHLVWDSILTMLDEVNIYTGGKYKELIEYTKRKRKFTTASWENNLKEMKKPEYSEFYNELSAKRKIRHYLRHYCPLLSKIIEPVYYIKDLFSRKKREERQRFKNFKSFNL